MDTKVFATEKERDELKMVLDRELGNIEKAIYDLESNYLEETVQCGNVLKGWDNYMSLKNQKTNPPFNLKKNKISANERIFSQSSITSQANKKVEEEAEANTNGGSGYTGATGIPYYKRKTKRKTQGMEPRILRGTGGRNTEESHDNYDNSDLDSSLDSRAKSGKKKKNTGSKFKNKKGKN